MTATHHPPTLAHCQPRMNGENNSTAASADHSSWHQHQQTIRLKAQSCVLNIGVRLGGPLKRPPARHQTRPRRARGTVARLEARPEAAPWRDPGETGISPMRQPRCVAPAVVPIHHPYRQPIIDTAHHSVPHPSRPSSRCCTQPPWRCSTHVHNDGHDIG